MRKKEEQAHDSFRFVGAARFWAAHLACMGAAALVAYGAVRVWGEANLQELILVFVALGGTLAWSAFEIARSYRELASIRQDLTPTLPKSTADGLPETPVATALGDIGQRLAQSDASLREIRELVTLGAATALHAVLAIAETTQAGYATVVERGPDGTQRRRRVFDADGVPDAGAATERGYLNFKANTVVLEWFAGAAVLIGLCGTLFGLGAAIAAAIQALSGVSLPPGEFSPDALRTAQQVMSENLSKALAPLEFCFLSSLAGVGVALGLSLQRSSVLGFADLAFDGLEHDLRVNGRRLLPRVWLSPARRQQLVAAGLEKTSRDVAGMQQRLQDSMQQILGDAVDTIKTQLKPIGENLAEALGKGIDGAMKTALDDVQTRHKTYLETVEEKLLDVHLGYTKTANTMEEATDGVVSRLVELTGVLTSLESRMVAAEGATVKRFEDGKAHLDEQFRSAVDEFLSQHKTDLAAARGPMTNAMNAVGLAVKDANGSISQMQGVLSDLPDDLRKKIEPAIAGVVDAAKEDFGSAVAPAVAAANDAMAAAELAAEKSRLVHDDATSNMDFAKTVLKQMNDALSEVLDNLDDKVGELLKSANGLGEQAVAYSQTSSALEQLSNIINEWQSMARAEDKQRIELDGIIVRHTEAILTANAKLESILDGMNKVNATLAVEDTLLVDTLQRMAKDGFHDADSSQGATGQGATT